MLAYYLSEDGTGVIVPHQISLWAIFGWGPSWKALNISLFSNLYTLLPYPGGIGSPQLGN